MKIRKVKNQLEQTKFHYNFKLANNFIKQNFLYNIYTDKNNNIIKITKEGLNNEYFEIEYFEIV